MPTVGASSAGRANLRRRPQRVGNQRRQLILRPGLVARFQVREGGELHVAGAAVDLLRLLAALVHLLAAVPLARLQLEQRPQLFALHQRIAGKRQLADPVAGSLGDGNPQLHPARLAVLGVLEHLQLGLSDAGTHVPLVLVVLDDPIGVGLELVFLVGAAAGDEREDPLRLVLFQLALERAVADGGVADEVDLANLDLRPLADVERHVHQLGSAGHRRDLVIHFGVGEALLGHHRPQHGLHPPDHALIEERIEPQLDATLPQLLFDLGAIDLLAALVFHDLDPLALLHVVGRDHAHGAVRERVLLELDRQVLEEAGRPQRLEVGEHRPLRRIVQRHEHALRRLAGPQLDVIHVGLVLDGREPALALEAGLQNPDERRTAGRRQRGRGRQGITAGGGLDRARWGGGLRRRRRGRGRGGIGLGQGAGRQDQGDGRNRGRPAAAAGRAGKRTKISAFSSCPLPARTPPRHTPGKADPESMTQDLRGRKMGSAW